MRRQILSGAQATSEHTLRGHTCPHVISKPTRNEGELVSEYFRDSWGLGSSDQGHVTVQLPPPHTCQVWDLSPAKQDLIPEPLLSCQSGSPWEGHLSAEIAISGRCSLLYFYFLKNATCALAGLAQ